MPRKFLAPRASAGDGYGYRNLPLRRLPSRSETNPHAYDSELVDQAERVAAASTMADEPECCSDDLADYAATAAFWRSQRHTAEVLAMQQIRPLLRAEDRLKDAQRRAKQAKRRDLKGEFVALQGMLARYQRVDDEPKPGSSLLNRLEGVEAKLDGIGPGGVNSCSEMPPEQALSYRASPAYAPHTRAYRRTQAASRRVPKRATPQHTEATWHAATPSPSGQA